MSRDTGAPLRDGLSQAEPEVSALRASIPSAMAQKVFATLAALEGHAPPETSQDWDCVAASQVIRSLCLLLTEPASAIEAGTAATVKQGAVHESATRQGDAQ